MKKTRFAEEQMVKILREADKSPVVEVAKTHGVSDATFYNWRSKYGGMEASEAERKNIEDRGALPITSAWPHPYEMVW
jgi:putative transposase